MILQICQGASLSVIFTLTGASLSVQVVFIFNNDAHMFSLIIVLLVLVKSPFVQGYGVNDCVDLNDERLV